MKTRSIILASLLIFVLMFGLVGCLHATDPDADSSSTNGGNSSEPITFKLMSYNMRVDATSNKRVEYDTVLARTPLILKHIADADPDVICVQEWTYSHLQYVAPDLEEDYNIEIFHRDALGLESAAILFKKDRFELISTEKFWLSETPNEMSIGWDASYHRIYSAVILRDKLSGKTFRAATTHLDLAKVAIGQQRKMVVDYTANSTEPALVCGDFNFNPSSSLYLYCINTLNDCRALDPNATTTASYNGYNLVKDEEVLDDNGNVKDGYGLPIDHIFVKRNAFTVHSYDVLNYMIDGKFSSDHFPIVVKLSIND